MKRKGFILVTALGVSVLILILGLGIIFMAQSNLDVASNLRQNTEVRYRAEAGIDHALAFLKEKEAAPDWGLSTLTATSGGDRELVNAATGYTVILTPVGTTQMRILSTSTGGRSAEYVAEALITRDSSSGPPTTLPPVSRFNGLRSSSITLDGSICIDRVSVFIKDRFNTINALQGGTVRFNDQNTASCPTTPATAANPVGSVPGGQTYTAEAAQILKTRLSIGPAVLQNTDCGGHWVCRSDAGAELLADPGPEIPKRKYSETLARQMTNLGVPGVDVSMDIATLRQLAQNFCNTTATAQGVQCFENHTVFQGSMRPSGQKFIFLSGVTFQGLSSNDFSNSTMVSFGAMLLPEITGENVNLLALDINFNGSKAQLSGRNVLASQDSFEFSGSTSNDENCKGPDDTSGNYTEISSDVDLQFNSSGTFFCGNAFAERNLSTQGEVKVRGGLSSQGIITLNNGVTVADFNAPPPSSPGSPSAGPGTFGAMRLVSRK
jgi:hypothetical protein